MKDDLDLQEMAAMGGPDINIITKLIMLKMELILLHGLMYLMMVMDILEVVEKQVL